jgi:hypothetical protein
MKLSRFLAVCAVALAAWLGTAMAPASAQVGCNQSIFYDASTNGATRLVTGAAKTRIFICGYNLWAAGTATVKFETGTGTACATNETAITPAFSLTTQTGVPDDSPFWRGLTVQPGLDFCIKTSAGVAVQAIVYFSQQ